MGEEKEEEGNKPRDFSARTKLVISDKNAGFFLLLVFFPVDITRHNRRRNAAEENLTTLPTKRATQAGVKNVNGLCNGCRDTAVKTKRKRKKLDTFYIYQTPDRAKTVFCASRTLYLSCMHICIV